MDTRSWYAQLQKPNWAPAESVFGQVWSVLYPVIIVVNIYVIYLLFNNKISLVIATPFWANLAFNIAFTPLQFGLRNNTLAFIDIILVLATIVWAIVAIWPHAKIVSIAFLPYLIWVAIATALQGYITLKN